MADGSRIPRQIIAFHLYFSNGLVYLNTGNPTNAARLLLPVVDTNFMASINASWVPLMAKYSDKSNSRTNTVIEQLNLLIEKFVNYDRTTFFLNRIASSPTVTVTDLEVFNIKESYLRTKTRSVSQNNIDETVSASVTPLGGAQFSIRCRILSNGRATICEGADMVQYTYVVGTAPDAAGQAGQSKEISTKASFTLVLEPINSGKILYIYFRWYNSKHPSLAGPWSVLYTSFIL